MNSGGDAGNSGFVGALGKRRRELQVEEEMLTGRWGISREFRRRGRRAMVVGGRGSEFREGEEKLKSRPMGKRERGRATSAFLRRRGNVGDDRGRPVGRTIGIVGGSLVREKTRRRELGKRTDREREIGG